MDIYKVGSNVDAWCTKCRLILAHTIEAILEDKIKRVKCNTCGGKHQFRSSEPGEVVKKSKIKTQTLSGSKTKSKASDLKNLLAGKDLTNVLNYNTKTHFYKGNLIKHIHFGLGVVVEEKDVGKIEVLFEEGAKILIHARV